MALVNKQIYTLLVDKGEPFLKGRQVVCLYKDRHFEHGVRYRCCLEYNNFIRVWVTEEEVFIPIPACECGNTTYYEVDNIKECRSCGTIIVGTATIPNKETTCRPVSPYIMSQEIPTPPDSTEFERNWYAQIVRDLVVNVQCDETL